jgi:hypothetical protein
VVEKEVAEKEATGKEVVEKEGLRRRRLRKRTMRWRKISHGGHREATKTTAPSAPSDFQESSIGSSVPFASTICISTRIVHSYTSNT